MRSVVALTLVFAHMVNAEVIIVRDGKARAIIYVSAEVMAPDRGIILPHLITHAVVPEAQRRRLRESVNDLAHYLQKMSGAVVPIVTEEGAKPATGIVPVYIGDRAVDVFGTVGKSYPFKQAFRVVVSGKPARIGLMGESDLATSYAIFEVLDRLGCRWFMPSEMGEVIPARRTIRLKEMDFKSAPGTYSRNIWYADDAYRRRNRLGGLYLASGDALEHYITAEQRAEHPEWRATVDGKRKSVV